MTALVEDKVALWLSAHPGATLVEIARGVHAKDATVREALSSPLFTFSLSGKAYRYYLRGSQRDGQGRGYRRPEPETDCDFLLRVLSDGEPHSLNEILRRSFADRGCGLTVHSRASDLRARGYRIDNWKDGARGDGSKYRLVPLGEEGSGETATDPGRSPLPDDGLGRAAGTVPYQSPSSPSGAADGVSRGAGEQSGAALQPDGQLTFAAPEFRRKAAA